MHKNLRNKKSVFWEFNLEKDQILYLEQESKRLDITVNELLEDILWSYINSKHKKHKCKCGGKCKNIDPTHVI